MVDCGAQRWALTLLRGLLCVLLALTFTTPTLRLDERPPSSTQDEVSDDAQDSLASWLGRGGPRIVKRLVGVDHWAINAVVPNELRECSSVEWVPPPISILPPSAEYRVAPARGPPHALTI